MAVRWIMAACLLHIAVAFPLPDPGLLRVPRIYNALITSDAKLQPSRAYPYSTPVFQPLGLGPVPEFDFADPWQTPSYIPGPVENMKPEEPAPNSNSETTTAAPKLKEENAKTESESKKVAPPLTFYPRSFGYYQTQPIISYTYPFAHNPYVYTSPFGFEHSFYKYPVLPYDGYLGGYLGLDHIDSVHRPDKMEGKNDNMKGDATLDKESDVRSRSDEVGVREVEFLSDIDESIEGPESADLKKAEPTKKS